jgi:hypothetical protein
VAQGDAQTIALLAAHDVHFTFGENVGGADCDTPSSGSAGCPRASRSCWTCGDHAYGGDAAATAPSRPGTTAAGMSNTVAIPTTGRRTGVREVPRPPASRAVPFELAVGVDETAERLLREKGWRHVDSVSVSRDAGTYRAYIQRSRGEFTVARDQYVRPNTGWFQ